MCPNCGQTIAPTYQGLYCPNCGKPLWDARPLQEQSQGQGDGAEIGVAPDLADGSDGADRGIPVFRVGQPSPPSEYHPYAAGPLPIRPLSHAGTGGATAKFCIWEVRDQAGRIRAFLSTFFRSCLSPVSFFKQLPPKGGYSDALLFAILANLFAAIVNVGWFALTRDIRAQFEKTLLADPWLGPMVERVLKEMPEMTLTRQMLPVVGSPIYTIIWLLLFAVLFHLFLFLFAGARKGLQATFRCLAYASSVNLMTALFSPMCGGILWLFWMPIVVLIAFVQVHEIRLWRTLLAVVAPGLILVALLLFSFLWLALTIVAGMTPV